MLIGWNDSTWLIFLHIAITTNINAKNVLSILFCDAPLSAIELIAEFIYFY